MTRDKVINVLTTHQLEIIQQAYDDYGVSCGIIENMILDGRKGYNEMSDQELADQHFNMFGINVSVDEASENDLFRLVLEVCNDCSELITNNNRGDPSQTAMITKVRKMLTSLITTIKSERESH